MRKKVIAIGNRIMGDDGIGIAIAEYLKEFMVRSGFEVIIGETDIEYCLSLIESGDFIIILDAVYSGLEPGTVNIMSIKEAVERSKRRCSQHEPNLLLWLDIYGIEVKGAVIGIEAETIELNWGLSDTLEKIFPLVCESVIDKIKYVLKEGSYA